ncbi:PaaI family thioesterase [Pararhodobacter zhoushanensis]|uniref:PaaI family thioesterase n=1 Tax=Pararhodobacter zhoushanensis TaxID=2479545 RepID=A0ABT3H0P6_9RHOB|nr:PaaI family thioesterase [Pararhodobacter zhoushanensis]MCW1933372.1 PaaI family thioesterase [Pararhodobacter zhoushanensis]
MTPVMDAASLNSLMAEIFPQVAADFRVERVASMEADVRLLVGDAHLRPGGTVSGPSMFALADLAMYAVLLAMIGPVALAVTTNASIDFMRKPEAGRDLIGRARLHKLGKVLAVGDVLITNDGAEAVLARSSMTYAIPPER